MSAGARVAWSPPGIVGARATKVQFGELRAVSIPLEHHALCPIMPERRGQDDVLVNGHRRMLFLVLRPGVVSLWSHDGEVPAVGRAVDVAVLVSQVHVGDFVVRLVYW